MNTPTDTHTHTHTHGSVDVIDRLRAALDTNPDAIRDALTLRPCHITGCHRPNHHLDYTCTEQKARMFNALLGALGVLVPENLPRALHGPSCSHCHTVPSQEEYRDRLRRTHQWAGIPVSEDLSAPANDAPRPEDAPMLLAAYAHLHHTTEPDTWHSAVDRNRALAHIGMDGIPWERVAAADRNLVEAGLIEERTIRNLVCARLTPTGLTAAATQDTP